MKRRAHSTSILLAIVALVSVLGAVTGPTAPAMADVAAVVVTWPEATQVNPQVTPYTFTVTDNQTGSPLFYTWGWQDLPAWQEYGTQMPDSGSETIDFTDRQGHGAVRLWTCPGNAWSANCVEVARSPELDVWYETSVGNAEGGSPPRVHSGVVHHRIYFGPQAPIGQDPVMTWELLGPDKLPLDPQVTGTVDPSELDPAVLDPETGSANVSFTIPQGLPSGTYYLDVRLAVDTVDFGHLTGSMLNSPGGPLELTVDNDAPTVTVRKTIPTLYPVTDDYLDFFTVYAKASEWSTAALEITNAEGVRVFRSGHHQLSDTDFNWYDAPSWNGRQAGKIVPEGRYKAALEVTDLAGNNTTWTAPLTVSHKSLKWTMFKRTVTAAGSLAGKPFVGKCSTLASPAKGGPKGSLGFYSATRCHGTLSSASVATTHGIYIPQAFRHHYDYSQVIVNGGPVTARKTNYLYLAYLRPGSKRLWDGKFLYGPNGAHPGMRYDGANVFDKSTDKPYILWYNGLTAGSRYNVRSYTVVVRYQALR